MMNFMNESQIEKLENMTRYHSGQWSTDLKEDKNFKISDLKHETFFLHILDMLSTNNCLKVPKIEESK